MGTLPDGPHGHAGGGPCGGADAVTFPEEARVGKGSGRASEGWHWRGAHRAEESSTSGS